MYDLHLPIHPSYRVFEKTMLVQKLHSNRKVCQVKAHFSFGYKNIITRFYFFCFLNIFLRTSPCSEELVRSSGKFTCKQSIYLVIIKQSIFFPEVTNGGNILYLAQSYAVYFFQG